MNIRIFAQCDHQVMEIRFGQGRYEIDAGLFKRIDNLRRDFSFHVSSWQVKHRSLSSNTEASRSIQEAGGPMILTLFFGATAMTVRPTVSAVPQ
jgi:hypothetical protein